MGACTPSVFPLILVTPCDSTSQQLHMASYDITSLFTNIPPNETIDIICNIIFRDSQSYHNFTKETLRKALQLTCTNAPFLFNKQIFRQTDGVAMGSPLGPTLANIFLCHHESQWLTNCPSQFTPLVYKRYVDDTFTAFSDPSHYNLFLNYLNSKHPNIKFTLEPASNQTIPFLDCLVTHTNSFKTQVYRKPTFTGLAPNFNSFIYSKFKINSIRTLIHRAYHVSSTFSFFNKEISFLRDLYKNNGYPAHLLDKYVKLFLNNIFSPKTPIPTVPKRKFYISLPFYGSVSETAYLHLFRTLSSHFTHLNFQPVPKTSTTIGSFFRSKDRVPDELQADVIYQYTCGGCKSAYVGSTHRRSLERFSEHLGISHRTKKPLNSPPFSHIRNHGYNNNHPISLRSFKIIDSASPSNLAISESLHILQIISYPGQSHRMIAKLTQRAIESINQYETKWKIKTNTSKFTIIPINRLKTTPVTIDNTQIQYKSEGTCLGLRIGTHGYSHQISQRRAIAHRRLNKLNRFKNLSQKNKRHLYIATVSSAMLYPCIPLHVASKNSLRKLQTIQNRATRFITGKTKIDRITSKQLHKDCSLEPINIILHNRAQKAWQNMETQYPEIYTQFPDTDTSDTIRFPSSKRQALSPEPAPLYT